MSRASRRGPPHTELIDLDVSDEALVNISQERVLALTLEEMRILRDYLKNRPCLPSARPWAWGPG